jgi:energy-coupling factor transport system permease protein
MTTRVATHASTGSWLHRLGAIPKLAWAAAGVATALVTFDPVPLLAIATAAVVVAATAGEAGRVLRTMVPFAPLAASILLVQVLAPLACRPTCTVATTVGPLTLYADGLTSGLSFVARLLTIELVAFTAILATRAPDMLAALVRMRVPSSMALAVAMALQLVPILQREMRIVLDAQRIRGLRVAGPTALARAIVPVIVASVERAQQVAISLEARGFGSGIARTSYREVSLGPVDVLLAAGGVVAGIAGVAAGLAFWGPGSFAWPALPAWAAVAVLLVAGIAFTWAVARGVLFAIRA